MDTRNTSAVEEIRTRVRDHVPEGVRHWSERNRAWLVAAAFVAVVALIWYLFFYTPAAPPPKPKVIPVSTAEATTENLPVSISALGAAQAWTSVTILAQVSGKLLSVNFAEGSFVKAGDVLAQVDPAPYRAALLQAQGALERDKAMLANARVDLARYKALVAQNAISQQVYATQFATVKQDEGTVILDQGQVDMATVNLGWCRIVSPIDGRVGVRLVDPGNLVSASGAVSSQTTTASATNNSPATGTNSNSGIVIVNQITPMAVTFTVPQGDFQRLAQASDGFRSPMQVKAFSQDSGALLDTGELSIADNRVDPGTGTVELKARFPNAKEQLWPGQFVNVQLQLQILQHVTTVPVTAINKGPSGMFLFVVEKDKTVSMRPVVLGWTEADTAQITSGVKPGEVVVTDGQMILKPGSTVRIVQPARRRTT